ncbi:MAG: VF530 family protein [Proteobacteria bacterium]|nr:VF530 family protein [Pseudomonadota bacterium]MBU1232182.1 VF530 family protein [Pseudomonadota bacterium]MBU1417131.1 VF530 family protein [Pseudomonadota bacterium]MBU1453827.1 VF530 family protein [Pseudomonadota bacterium]
MSKPQSKNPLEGITLEMILTRLVEQYGWYRLGKKIDINCFTKTPSINSSLKFLRKTPWAREKVETLYLRTKFSSKVVKKANVSDEKAENVWLKKKRS